MLNIIKYVRYVVFGSFIICSAVVASVAVWNHSIAEVLIDWNSGIDIYLTCLGCLGLVFIFTIIAVELIREDPVTSFVWVECVWVCLFWLLYLVGSIVVSVTEPKRMCEALDVPAGTGGAGGIGTTSPALLPGGCPSARVLIAFCWISTIILLLYFSLLVSASAIHAKHDPRIWTRQIHRFPWRTICRLRLPSPPSSPTRHNFAKRMPSVVAPRPQKAVPPTIFKYNSGLSAEYEIEHYRPPESIARPEPAACQEPPHGAAQISHIQNSSFYAQHLQPMLVPRTPPSWPQMGNQLAMERESPSVLGDWPRLGAVMEPLRPQRRKPNQADLTTSNAAEQAEPGTTLHATTSLRSHPTGPRRKTVDTRGPSMQQTAVADPYTSS